MEIVLGIALRGARGARQRVSLHTDAACWNPGRAARFL